MADGKRVSIRDLDLSPSQQTAMGELVAASVAVNVYRQLDNLRGDTSGCNIFGNCTSSSSKLLAEEAVQG